MKIRHTVSSHFQVYCPCLQVSQRNTRLNGANFVVNSNKTPILTVLVKSSSPNTTEYLPLDPGKHSLSTLLLFYFICPHKGNKGI